MTEIYRLKPSPEIEELLEDFGFSPKTMVADDYVEFLKSNDALTYETRINKDKGLTLIVFTEGKPLHVVMAESESETIPMMLAFLVKEGWVRSPFDV